LNQLKVLVFEYISGGGFAGRALPAKLAAEGALMLQALLDELKPLSALEILLLLDERCRDFSLPLNTEVIGVEAETDWHPLWAKVLGQADCVWPIAPETDGLLAELARQVLAAGKTLLLSEPGTVALCADKLQTYHCLLAHGLAAVPSCRLNEYAPRPFAPTVIKPIDGVGCEGNRILSDIAEFDGAWLSLGAATHGYLAQPLLPGRAVSLSCLFKQGQGWLLCCNEQQVAVSAGQFSLQGCRVNTANPRRDGYQTMVAQVAEALPGLWGYVGIDLIETDEYGPLILEINPRLTTSYVGIQQATGINVAEQVLQLLQGVPQLKPVVDHTVNISID